MGRIENDQLAHAGGMVRGQVPGDDAAPVVPDDVRGAARDLRNELLHVAHQLGEGVVAHPRRLFRLVVAA